MRGVLRSLDRLVDIVGLPAIAVAVFVFGARFVLFDTGPAFDLLTAIVVLYLASQVASSFASPGVRRGLDLAVDLVGVLAWGFAAFVIGSRFVSDAAGALIGVGMGLSALALALNTHLQEGRMRQLAAGVCPRCRARVTSEHRHRRWDASRSEWLAPLTSWECRACGYEHNEAWACPACPEKE